MDEEKNEERSKITFEIEASPLDSSIHHHLLTPSSGIQNVNLDEEDHERNKREPYRHPEKELLVQTE